MAWKRRSTSAQTYVEVDLCDFDTAELLQALIDRKAISEAEAEGMLNREKVQDQRLPGIQTDISIAFDEFRRGHRDEGLLYLERGLGRDWYGMLTQ